MSEPEVARDYHERDVQAAYSVLIEIGQVHIAGKFRHVEDFGPSTVRLFLEESAALGEMTPEQVQTDAFMQVSALLRGMGLQK